MEKSLSIISYENDTFGLYVSQSPVVNLLEFTYVGHFLLIALKTETDMEMLGFGKCYFYGIYGRLVRF